MCGNIKITIAVLILLFSFNREVTAGDLLKKNVRSRDTVLMLDQEELRLFTGESVQLKAELQPAPAVEYKLYWKSNAENIVSVDSTGKVTAHAEGWVDLEVYTNDGKYFSSCFIEVAAKEKFDLQVYPNPATTHINIFAELDGTKDVEVRIFDNKGSLVYRRNYGKLQKLEEQLNISQMPSGMYIVQYLADGKEIVRKRFMK